MTISSKRMSSLDEIIKVCLGFGHRMLAKPLHVYHLHLKSAHFQLHLFEGESEDVKVFTRLIKQLLRVNWSQRITASQALKHPSFTRSHLNDHRWDD